METQCQVALSRLRRHIARTAAEHSRQVSVGFDLARMHLGLSVRQMCERATGAIMPAKLVQGLPDWEPMPGDEMAFFAHQPIADARPRWFLREGK